MAKMHNTKMVIVKKAGRQEKPISWATGDYWAMRVVSKILATDDGTGEYYWRPGQPAEIAALEALRGPKGKLAGW